MTRLEVVDIQQYSMYPDWIIGGGGVSDSCVICFKMWEETEGLREGEGEGYCMCACVPDSEVMWGREGSRMAWSWSENVKNSANSQRERHCELNTESFIENVSWLQWLGDIEQGEKMCVCVCGKEAQ